MRGRIGLYLLVVHLLCIEGRALGGRAGEIVEQADVVYSTSFRAPCSPQTWERLVGNPLLMGDLWAEYGYAPAYRVSQRGEVLHVQDPTGLVGDVRLVDQGPEKRVYLADGKLDHWAVPFLNEGAAVFVLESRVVQGGIDCKLDVYLRAESAMARWVLQLGESLLLKHVANRVTLNVQDAMKIFSAVDAHPEGVLAQLEGEAARRFKAVF